MSRERLGTGLAVAALGALVLSMVLIAARFGLGGLGPFGFFGGGLPEPDGRVVVIDPETPLPGGSEPASPEAQAPAPPPAPATPDLPPAAAPAPGTDPVPAPEPAPPASVPPTPPATASEGGLQATTGSVVRLASATVGGLGSTVGDVVDLVVDLLSSPAQEGEVTAVQEARTAAASAGQAAPPAPAAHDRAAQQATSGSSSRPEGATHAPSRSADRPAGRDLPTTPRPPTLPQQAAPAAAAAQR